MKSINWTQYEHEFYDLCISKKWFIQQDQEDGSTYLEPAREDKRGLYRVYSHGPGLCGIIIIAEGNRPAAIKNTILKKLIKAKIITGKVKKNGNSIYIESPNILTDCDGEAIAIFKIDRLARVVKTLNLKKQPKETKKVINSSKVGQAALTIMREKYSKDGRDYLVKFGFKSERIIGKLLIMAEENSWTAVNQYIVDNLFDLKEQDQKYGQ